MEQTLSMVTIVRGLYNPNQVFPDGTMIMEIDNYDSSYQLIKRGNGRDPYCSLPTIFSSTATQATTQYMIDQQRQKEEEARNNLRNQIRYEMEYEMKCKMQEMEDKLNRSVTYIHECKSCGGKLELPEDNKGVFHCKYCNAVYAIGTYRFNSVAF